MCDRCGHKEPQQVEADPLPAVWRAVDVEAPRLLLLRRVAELLTGEARLVHKATLDDGERRHPVVILVLGGGCRITLARAGAGRCAGRRRLLRILSSAERVIAETPEPVAELAADVAADAPPPASRTRKRGIATTA